jgi:hypothetical protein
MKRASSPRCSAARLPRRSRRAGNQRRRCPPAPTPIASAQAFCHCSANCTQNCIGLLAAPAKAPALGQVPAGLAPGKDFSFESIADVAVTGFGDLICSCTSAFDQERCLRRLTRLVATTHLSRRNWGISTDGRGRVESDSPMKTKTHFASASLQDLRQI